jgi:membrane protease YdiL (CAAX protease family)
MQKNTLIICGQIFLLTIISFAIITCFLSLFHYIEYKNSDLLNITNICKLFFLSLCVAITEEIIFRGYILNFCINKIGYRSSILLVSIFFAFSHFDSSTLIPYITTFLGGLIFAMLSIRTKSLLPAIMFHLAWNFSQMLISILFLTNLSIPFGKPVFEISQILFLFIVLGFLKFDIINKVRKCFSLPK